MRGFSVTCCELADGTYVVTVSGELDLYGAPRLARALAWVESARGETIVDLLPCTFVDATGLMALVDASRALRPRGRRLTLCCTDRNILRLLDMTGLARHFTLVCSLEELAEDVIVQALMRTPTGTGASGRESTVRQA